MIQIYFLHFIKAILKNIMKCFYQKVIVFLISPKKALAEGLLHQHTFFHQIYFFAFFFLKKRVSVFFKKEISR
jgi:hypothetical protein